MLSLRMEERGRERREGARWRVVGGALRRGQPVEPLAEVAGVVEANSGDVERLKKAIPEKVYEISGLATGYVAVCGVGGLPKTSSGKVQRRKTKQLYEDGLLAEHGTGRVGDGGDAG